MTNRRDTHMRANRVLRSHSTISGRHTLESSPSAVRSVKRRRAIKLSTDATSEASARRRRAAIQWICVAG
eukprot:4038598-Prymnesium_polylepis.1